MADGDRDIKEQALSSTHDFYELLEVATTANEAEIRRAYRKTALKYHPDKAGGKQETLDKFHLLQIAYEVLTDSAVRQLYDNARRAREEKKERDAAYDGRRRHLKEELERRESAGAAGLKRKRDEVDEEEAFQRVLEHLAADGARRRKEREEQLRRELNEREQDNNRHGGDTPVTETNSSRATEFDLLNRTIKLRCPVDSNVDQEIISSRFGRFGKIQDVRIRTKKIKAEGKKHRQEFITGIIVFESIVGAHAAITDFPELAKTDRKTWGYFEEVNWASGKEPDCIPKSKAKFDKVVSLAANDKQPTTPIVERIKSADAGGGLKKVPSFSSFKGTPRAAQTPGANGSPSMEELMMMRLKNAERKRLADKLRKEEAEAEAQAES